MVEQNASSQDPFRLDLTVAMGALPDDLLGNPILLTRIHPAPRAAITENLSIQSPEGERFSRLSHYEAFDNLAELCLRVGTNATYS